MRWVYRVASGAGAVVILTGLYLYWWYRPSGSDFGGVGRPLHADLAVWLHIAGGVLFVFAGIAAVVPQLGRDARVRVFLHFVLILLAGGGAFMTGGWLAWDMLALWAVTVGENASGLDFLFDDNVRFALVDGQEVSVTTMKWVLATHLGLALTVGLGIVLYCRIYRRSVAAARAVGESVVPVDVV